MSAITYYALTAEAQLVEAQQTSLSITTGGGGSWRPPQPDEWTDNPMTDSRVDDIEPADPGTHDQVWLPGPGGLGHAAGPPGHTRCGVAMTGMRPTTVTACAVYGIPLCTRCFPQVVLSPGWPLKMKVRLP